MSIDDYLSVVEGDNNSNNDVIFQGSVMRTKDDTLIVPDDVYNAITNGHL